MIPEITAAADEVPDSFAYRALGAGGTVGLVEEEGSWIQVDSTRVPTANQSTSVPKFEKSAHVP